MMDRAELELFEQSLHQANVDRSGAALDAVLVDLGWHDALAADPRAAISLQFEHQGRAGATSSALEHVVGWALGIDEPGAVVLPVLGTWAPPARSLDGQLVIDGIGTQGFAGREQAVVVTAAGDETAVVTVPVAALAVEPIAGIDPDLGLARVAGAVAGTATLGTWDEAVDLARLALAHELVGASRSMLDQACTHALERVQFGQPIARFQAVRHRLAESLVAIEAADALLDAAWIEGTPDAAAMAKAVAGRGARTVARHSQQVLAGIGFTTEHPFHTSVRRVLVLDQLFGSARTLTAALGTDVLTSRRLPPLLAL